MNQLTRSVVVPVLAACFALVSSAASAAETFKLVLNQTVAFGKEGHRVTFVFAQDSRCPAGAQCIIAGSAYALLWVEMKNKRSLVAVTSPNQRVALEVSNKVDGYEFCYVGLEPAPDTKRQIQPRDRVLSFSVNQPGAGVSQCEGSGAANR